MKALRALALLLSLAGPCLGAVARVPVRALPQAPLVTLGGLLTLSLPGLATVDPLALTPTLVPSLSLPALPSPVPVLADARKAAALLERAAALPAAEEAGAGQAQAEPLKVLEAVNATLKDFTAEDIRSMPEERLQALAGMILDGAAGRAPRADLAAVTAIAEANLSRVTRLKKSPLKETLLNPGHPEIHGDIITVSGVPEVVRPIEAGERVFRHYTTKEGLDAILAEKTLWNGFLSYVQLARSLFRKSFKDLTGVFLTVPGVDGQSVGVPAKEFPYWVDLKVPGGLPVLEVEKEAIYLIPMPGRTRSWVADMYRRWVSGAEVEPHYRKMVEELDREGGLGPDLSVPITIVGHGKTT